MPLSIWLTVQLSHPTCSQLEEKNNYSLYRIITNILYTTLLQATGRKFGKANWERVGEAYVCHAREATLQYKSFTLVKWITDGNCIQGCSYLCPAAEAAAIYVTQTCLTRDNLGIILNNKCYFCRKDNKIVNHLF
ncbi:hypothetical protein KY285_008648 [Solanum tuberosum]|nr:hypothetical protein KY285_008648 [Solanum tuberosum]